MLKRLILIFSLISGLIYANEVKNFTLKTVDGKTIHIEVNDKGIKVKEYPNKIIILDFFGKNCPPCKAEMPILGKLQEKYKDKVQIIGLHVQEPLDLKDLSMIKNRGVNFLVIDYLQDKNNKSFVYYMADLTGWQGQIPYMLFFDKKGTYKGFHLGMMDEETLERIVKRYSK